MSILLSWARLVPRIQISNSLKGLVQTLLPPMSLSWSILQVNRNARAPKKANHGARPCSSVMRRMKKRQHYKKWKQNLPAELQQDTDIPKKNSLDDDQ